MTKAAANPETNPNGRGRESKFTREVRAAVLQGLRAGMSKTDAAAMGGISLRALDSWCEIGEAIEADAEHPRIPSDLDRRTDFVLFVRDVKSAQAQGRLARITQVTVAGQDSWMHTITGTIRRSPPPPITWMHQTTGELRFDAPPEADSDVWEREFSGQCWKFRQGEWTAAAWYLERSDPQSWGRRSTLQILGGVSEEKIGRMIAAIEERGYDVDQFIDTLLINLDYAEADPDSAPL